VLDLRELYLREVTVTTLPAVRVLAPLELVRREALVLVVPNTPSGRVIEHARGEQRAKRGVSRLAVPSKCFSIKMLFAPPLFSESEAQLHASGFCCIPPEIELL